MPIKIVIVGGGPAGSVTAILLAQAGFEVHMLYTENNGIYKAGETFPPNANSLFDRLKLSDLLLEGPHIRCPGNQSAFGSKELSDLDFIFSQKGLGWHIDRLFFEKQLLSRAKQYGVKLREGYSLKKVGYLKNQWLLSLSSAKKDSDELSDKPTKGEELNDQTIADYVIDASGRSRSFLRKIAIAEQNFDHIAARIAVFDCSDTKQQDHRTMIESIPEGWWYSSSTPDQKRVLMFFSASDNPKFRNTRMLSKLLQELKATTYIQKRIESEVGLNDLNKTEKCLWFGAMPAFTSLSTQIQGKNWLAVGDAAMTFDPLSSQGMLTAMESAEQAAINIINLHATNSKKQPTALESNSYVQWAENTFQTYMVERQKYYSLEQRWPDSTFWAEHRERILKDVS